MSKSHLIYVLKRLAIIQTVIGVGVLILCWVAGWHTVNDISMAMLVAGVIIFSIGPFSMMGAWGNTRNWQYQYTQSMREESASERIRQDKRDQDNAIRLVLPSVVLGTLTIILSVVIQTVFR